MKVIKKIILTSDKLLLFFLILYIIYIIDNIKKYKKNFFLITI